MSRPSEALFNRNADNCEMARRPKCVCACAGAMHGFRHSLDWRSETFAQLVNDAEEKAARDREPDLFDEGRAP